MARVFAARGDRSSEGHAGQKRLRAAQPSEITRARCALLLYDSAPLTSMVRIISCACEGQASIAHAEFRRNATRSFTRAYLKKLIAQPILFVCRLVWPVQRARTVLAWQEVANMREPRHETDCTAVVKSKECADRGLPLRRMCKGCRFYWTETAKIVKKAPGQLLREALAVPVTAPAISREARLRLRIAAGEKHV